jgi:hypothetical protein
VKPARRAGSMDMAMPARAAEAATICNAEVGARRGGGGGGGDSAAAMYLRLGLGRDRH